VYCGRQNLRVCGKFMNEAELFIDGRMIESSPVLFRTLNKYRGSTSTQVTFTSNLEL